MDIILGQLWNLFVMLLLLSIVFVGLTMMLGQGKWGGKLVGRAWKWLLLSPFRVLKWLGKSLWRLLFPKKKKSSSSGGGGHRGHT